MDFSKQRLSDQLRHLTELETRLSFRISRMSRLLDAQVAKLLTGKKLNLTSYRILLVTEIFGEISQAELSQLQVIDPAQVSRITASLNRSGLVSIRQDPTNKRRKLVSLTQAGTKTLDFERRTFEQRRQNLEGLLTKTELTTLNTVITKITGYLADELKKPDANPLELRESD